MTNTTEKLSFLGIGPKIAIFSLPLVAISIIASYLWPEWFRMSFIPRPVELVTGWIVLAGGLVFYAVTVRGLLKGLRENRLITGGAYRLCQNPLYAAFIFFFLPAVALLTGSWLVLISDIAFYVAFKLYIRQEYEQLERLFGEEYLDYRRRTRELLPLPKRKK